MISLDDLVAAISAMQHSDLEAWIRDELVTPRQEAGTLLFPIWSARGSASSARCTMNLRLIRRLCRWCYRWSTSFTIPGNTVTDRGRSGAGQGRPSGDHRCDGAE